MRLPAGVLVLVLSACGSVQAIDPDATTADAWHSSCVLKVPLITTVNSDGSGYGDGCVHGSWNLQSRNGTTTPVTVGLSGNTAQVHPVGIAIGFDTLDTASTFAVHVSGSGQENMGSVSSYAQLKAPLNTISATQIGTVDASA